MLVVMTVIAIRAIVLEVVPGGVIFSNLAIYTIKNTIGEVLL